jgi:tight adherence protein C
MWGLLIFIGLVIIVAVVLVMIGIRNPQGADNQKLFERLDDYSKSGVQVDLEKLEMAQPFTERVIYPVARKLGEIAIRFTPQNWLKNISRKLELSGTSSKMDPTLFLALQFVSGIGFGLLLFVILRIVGKDMPTGRVLLFVTGITLVGFFFPQYSLSKSITRRQKNIRKAMPDALDLLTICVEAGLGFEAAMAKVAEKWTNELSIAFTRVIKEIQLGKLRREALHDMQDNIGLSEMTSFVAAVIQSEQLGVSMAKVLRIQADQMRIRRRQLAEEEAHKAPIKMLIPMAFLIFPSLLIVLLTPAVMRIMDSMLFK